MDKLNIENIGEVEEVCKDAPEIDSELEWADELLVDNSRMCRRSGLYPVMNRINKPIYFVSKDYKILSIDAGRAFRGEYYRRPIKYISAEERTDMIHTYINENLPCFRDEVLNIILKMDWFDGTEHFVIDAERLRESFPELLSIDYTSSFEISGVDDSVELSPPHELGERVLEYAHRGDFETANLLMRRLRELDYKLAKYFRDAVKEKFGEKAD